MRRKAVAAVAQRLRNGLQAHGHRTMGDVICPVFIGTTATGRVAWGLIARSGFIAHLVELPAVASDAARFRLQAMADHTPRRTPIWPSTSWTGASARRRRATDARSALCGVHTGLTRSPSQSRQGPVKQT
ncbi:hypothetical protein [Streptomyces sp. NPDC017435]|uniref:hypothetical protein n=1 Tax=Streptomyces sp. NPDC017435 TaxID=3364995 RepID=UPI00378AAF88